MLNVCSRLQLSDKAYHKDLSETLTHDGVTSIIGFYINGDYCFKANSHCSYIMEYWRNWWHSYKFVITFTSRYYSINILTECSYYLAFSNKPQKQYCLTKKNLVRIELKLPSQNFLSVLGGSWRYGGVQFFAQNLHSLQQIFGLEHPDPKPKNSAGKVLRKLKKISWVWAPK